MRVTEPVEPLIFSVRGTPRPKSRPRFVKGRVISTANPHEKLWKKAVERSAFAATIYRGDRLPLFTGPVKVTMIFTFVPPPTHPERVGLPHTDRPDKDNLEKLVLDAMVRARVLADDGLVSQGPIEKWWGLASGVTVRVEQIDAAERGPTASEAEPPDWLSTSG